MVNKLLFITLSNIGDVILTLPALDFLHQKYPEAKITVITAERPKEIFQHNPLIDRVIVYNKHSGLIENIRLFMQLKEEKFDAVIDLRNTLFGALLHAKYKGSHPRQNLTHMKQRHLYRAAGCLSEAANKKSLYIGPQDEEYIKNILKENNIGGEDKIIVVAAGARSHIKRWEREKFAGVCSELLLRNYRVILAGDGSDIPIAEFITGSCQDKTINLCGRTTISRLAALLKKSALLITNDSAVLHLGSYLNVPVVAVFGPTNDEKYGPWPDRAAVVKREIFCRPCEKAQCRFGTLECMRLVKVEDVLKAIKTIVASRPFGRAQDRQPPAASQAYDFKRILIVRTDRIGDVLLSTPAIKALRDAYPNAYIAVMVRPYAKDIVEGNPYLDEVIIYDKFGRHKSWLGSIKFTLKLKKKKFGLALVLHPTNRAHLIIFFAGIRKRVGYGRKLGFLLTDRVKHTKQFGEKHELEYNFDLLKHLGIEPLDKNLFMPVNPESEIWADEVLAQNNIEAGDRIVAIHPGASCPSKIWPNERFAEAADKLAQKYKFKVLILAGPKDIEKAKAVAQKLRSAAVNLAGRTSVSQLAGILKRCSLFISNDSGPVHIASAVGTPVISIFGRAQPGLSPRRWGPLGKKDKFLHKDVGCIECLAHNCVKEFKCLKAITVDDVLSAADSVLKE